jgi:hypothetical protein
VLPRFDHGDEVRVRRNVRNDGTFPGEPTGALLVRRGSVGYVRDVGTFLQDQIIYSVHFLENNRLVVIRAGPGAVTYHVVFPGRNTLQVPEDALELAVAQENGAA